MANAATVVTLDAVHAGIEAAIKEQFPTMATVEFYREDRKSLPLPACLLELSEFVKSDNDPGTEQLSMTARFEAVLVLGFRQDAGKKAKLEIRKLAAAFAAFVRCKRWGCPIGPAEVLGCYPDNFSPELDQFECWRVEWQQVIHLGETVWTDEGVTPTMVMGGWSPLIGLAHIDDYVPLDGGQ